MPRGRKGREGTLVLALDAERRNQACGVQDERHLGCYVDDRGHEWSQDAQTRQGQARVANKKFHASIVGGSSMPIFFRRYSLPARKRIFGNWGFGGFPFATYRTAFAIPTSTALGDGTGKQTGGRYMRDARREDSSRGKY